MAANFTYLELRALHEVARVLSRAIELKDQLQQILDVLSTWLGMERGMISILDLHTGEAWLDVARGVDVEAARVCYQPGEGITGKVAQTGRPMGIANLSNEAHFLDRTGARKSLNRAELAFLCVPILYQGRVVGVLSADKLAHQVESIEREVEILGAVVELLGKIVHFRAVEEENRRLRRMLAEARRPKTNIIGRSKVVHEVLRLIDQVADTNTTVLIHGETGTGKELVARAIHENSRRAKGPMVQVNCAAMPDTLLESELFGHEKGAFSGAITRRRGRFEEAQGGTIFLDEVGELSPVAQAKLLRVLQEREFQPLGSSRTVKVDVRVVTASNKNLEQEVAAGAFRSDLYYRLNVFPIFLPPLRERGPDILLLADFFVSRYAQDFRKNVKRISTSAIDMLMSYHWPGNVRELENCIERAVLLAGDEAIEAWHLPPTLQMKPVGKQNISRGKLEVLVGAFERDLITDALKDVHGNQSEAARLLGTTKRIIQYKVQKYGIDPKRFRSKPTA
ncbi:sigma-54-dependent Fis family transcriptional regulator [Desulfoferrobacter suflitae]|uniref:sigma-54-dependent Fis family transcriptional regulator n=1 Tax=Desulfoferrobacter suflitae TaxID=2865782 RepID=UPI002164A2D0|nr:sigma 54-interacting transcriptional regulator [Desulfoferrobacter suflitae]MCK8604052.1 sigma 54-interacting transcriptional regulator [Desulfoferrobacter suflitae]